MQKTILALLLLSACARSGDGESSLKQGIVNPQQSEIKAEKIPNIDGVWSLTVNQRQGTPNSVHQFTIKESNFTYKEYGSGYSYGGVPIMQIRIFKGTVSPKNDRFEFVFDESCAIQSKPHVVLFKDVSEGSSILRLQTSNNTEPSEYELGQKIPENPAPSVYVTTMCK